MSVLWEDKQNWPTFSQTCQEKREKNQINKLRNEKGEITTANVEMQSIIWDYYGQLYVNKMDNLEEMNRFLDKLILLILEQEEIEIMNHPNTSSKSKLWSKISQRRKDQDQMTSQAISVKHLEKS